MVLAAVFLWIGCMGLSLLMALLSRSQTTRPSFDRAAALALLPSGERVIQAVDAYEREFGLCPMNLSDLVPDRLNEQDASHWAYRTHAGAQDFSLLLYLEGGYVEFTTRELPSAWKIRDSAEHRPEKQLLSIERKKVRIGEGEHLERILIETARRSRVAQRNLVESKLHISALVQAERMNSALLRAEEARTRWPGDWWTHAALASIRQKLGQDGSSDLQRWAAKRDELRAHYVSFELHAAFGLRNEALEAILDARSTYGYSEYDHPRSRFEMHWRMARFALLSDAPRLALAIIGRSMYAHRDAELLTIRAAAHLELGELDDARIWSAKACEALPSNSPLAEKANELGRAAERGERSYRYEPSERPGPLLVFHRFRLGLLP